MAFSGTLQHRHDRPGHLHSLRLGVQVAPQALVHGLAEGVLVKLVCDPPAAQSGRCWEPPTDGALSSTARCDAQSPTTGLSPTVMNPVKGALTET